MKLFLSIIITFAFSSCMKAPTNNQNVVKTHTQVQKVEKKTHTRGISSVINVNLSLEDEIDLQAKQLESSLE